MSAIANSLDLVKIIKFKPANMSEWGVKIDRFARHPSVWPYMLSSLAGICIIKSLSVGLPDGAKRSSEYLHRDVIKEEYKAKHGHYPH